mgnify:CR=1 FL=1
MTDMKVAFYEEKRKKMDVIKYKGVEEMVDNTHSDLSGKAPDSYSSAMFSNLKYEDINKILNKKALANLIDLAYRNGTEKDTVLLADALMRLGYENATKAGISINVHDMTIPEEKVDILGSAYSEVDKITEEYNDGSITNGERYNKIVDVWAQTGEKLTKVMLTGLSEDVFTGKEGESVTAPSFNSL